MKALISLILFVSSSSMAQLVIEDNVKFLALGDSYTIGESVIATERWPSQLMDSLSARGLDYVDSRVIATTGWRTDNLAEAIRQAKIKPEYTLVSLLIGVNNFYQGKSADSYEREFQALLETAIKLAGGKKTRVFVLSIPDYGFTPFGKKDQSTISKGIDAFNKINEAVARKLDVKYYNITDISRRGLAEPDLVAFDGLHPSGKMYAEWIERILSDAKINHKNEIAEEDDDEDDKW